MSAAVLSTFRDYIAAFNAHDIENVLSFLDDDIQVFVDGALFAEGKETIKASYVRDFEAGKQVAIVKDPVVVEEDSIASKVKVALSNGQLQLEVVYTFRMSDLKQVQHAIWK